MRSQHLVTTNMPVMTRRQTAKLAENLAKSIEDENIRHQRLNEGLNEVLRERWNNSQKNANSALENVRILEGKVNALEKARDHFKETSKTVSKSYANAQNKIIEQSSEILDWEHSYGELENKYDDLYQKYQEMVIAAGAEIGGLEKTCENQALVIDRLETECNELKDKIESFEENEKLLKDLKLVVEDTLKPIETKVLSVNADAVSRMGKALLNVVGVQYKNILNFSEDCLDGSRNQENRETPEEFICSISGGIMEDPVMTSNGEIFDRKSIEQWQKTQQASNETDTDDEVPTFTSPLSRQLITGLFYPYAGLKRQIREWKEEESNKERALLCQALQNLKLVGDEAKKL